MTINKKNNSGFTIMELLIVIAIIGVLSTVVLSSLAGARAKGRDTARIRAVAEIKNALELYHAANISYPSGTESGLAAALVPTYISSIPADPLAGRSYQYQAYTNTSLTTACASAPCPVYHLGISLENANVVLNTDSDNQTTPGNIDGQSSTVNCTSDTGTDRCYDIVKF